MRQPEENIHPAASNKDCKEMGRRNGWRLIEVRENGDKILSKDCVFEGEQTSFQNDWHDHQD